MDNHTVDELDDIKYFKKKAINALVDEDWDRLLIAAKRLKQMEDSVIVYRLPRHPCRNCFISTPTCFVIIIRDNNGKIRWLQNDRWMLSCAFCDEYDDEGEALEKINNGSLPEIPEGYGEAFVEKVPKRSE